MTTRSITRRGMVRKAALAAAVAMMTLGFADLAAAASDATGLVTSHRVEPKGISELFTVSCPTPAQCVAAGTATGSTQSTPIPGVTSTVNGGASWSKGTLKGRLSSIADISCRDKEQVRRRGRCRFYALLFCRWSRGDHQRRCVVDRSTAGRRRR